MNTKMTTLMLGLTVVCTTLLGGWVVTRSHAAAEPTATRQAPDDELQRLLTARFDSATKALRVERAKLDNGKSNFEMVYQAAQRVLAAELDLNTTAAERLVALTTHVELMRQFEQEAARKVQVGVLPAGSDEAPRCWRLTAEVELLRAKRVSAGAK